MNVINIIKIDDVNYPQRLRLIRNPPKQLYYEGNIELLKTNIISIIGSRACSENGIMQAKKFAKGLVYQGVTVASGMAVGIDSAAHIGALEGNGKTIAVLPSGFNKIFPKQNIGLYHKILKKGGLVITEYQSDQKAEYKNFLERNRIVSGISLGVLVIEAAHRSGTSVTAKIAKEQEREVFALPHEIGNKHGVGTNRLISKGAKIVTSVRDIIKEYEFLDYKELPKEEIKEEEYVRKKCKNKNYSDIYKLIPETPISLNEIYRKSNKEIDEINSILIILEIEGYIEKVVGGYKCILEKK